MSLGPGQGLPQLGELTLALVLSALLGLERQLRNKSAGVRTHTLVGVGAALFMLVSKYGFYDVVDAGLVTLDPSRVAAQIVSGIGFIGGGIIFVRRDAVRGLTTAAVVWVTAAVGMACGGGLPVLAIGVTASHFAVVFGFTALSRRLPRSLYALSQVRITYLDRHGVLREALMACTDRGFVVVEVSVERSIPYDLRGRDDRRNRADPHPTQAVEVLLHIRGAGSLADITATISDLPGVLAVSSGADDSHAD